VHQGLVDDAVADDRRRGDAAAEALLPDDLPRRRVDREEAAALVRDEEPSVGDRRRELEVVRRAEPPSLLERRPVAVRDGDVGAGVVIAVGRPPLRPVEAARLARLRLRIGLGRGLRLRHDLGRPRIALVGRIRVGQELVDGRAAQVARLDPLVERRAGPRADHGQQCAGKGKRDEESQDFHRAAAERGKRGWRADPTIDSG